jgi:hypothetical protein
MLIAVKKNNAELSVCPFNSAMPNANNTENRSHRGGVESAGKPGRTPDA